MTFGFDTTLAGGCGNKTLVRIGAGGVDGLQYLEEGSFGGALKVLIACGGLTQRTRSKPWLIALTNASN